MMRFWGKKQTQLDLAHQGVAAAAAAGEPRDQWIRSAVREIAASTEAERIGVWLEAEPLPQTSTHMRFRGIVWDRAVADAPLEWSQLSTEAPLPPAVLKALASTEVDLEAFTPHAVLGPLLELRRALWVPVHTNGNLRGLLLAGAKQRATPLHQEPVERVASELALALEREEHSRRAQDTSADIGVAREVLRSLGSGASLDALLKQIVESCVHLGGGSESDLPVFAAIGTTERTFAASTAESRPARKLSFLWSAGSNDALSALQAGPLHGTWRTALETRRIVGAELHGVAAQSLVGRAVAIPLTETGEVLGVLVAILSHAATSLATLERLELRASLAATVLAQKRQDEDQSRHSLALRSALRASRQSVLLLGFQGNVLEGSVAALDLLRAPRVPSSHLSDDRLGKPLAGFFCPSERERVSAWLRDQFGSAVPGSSHEEASLPEPLRAILAGGDRMRLHFLGPAENSAFLLLLEPLAAQSAGLPSESVETELTNVIEWLEEGVILFDAHDNVRAINMRFEQMAGLASDESGKYQTLGALIARLEGHAADPLAFAERWRSLSRGLDGGVREELQMLQPVPRVLERSARPILDSVGRLLGRVEIYRDLTAQRVFQSKLLQTEKLAALGQMLTGVAHELSNPLTTVLGYAQRLLTRKDAAGRSEEARQIYQEAERATRILRQLLTHARETPPERRNLSLNQIVQRTLELQRFGLAAGKIHVELDLDPVLPQVRGDAGQLQQVLMNLLGNAQQALEQQGIGGTIRVRTRHEEGNVTLTVEDTGPGIPPAILARVFDPFFTTKPAGVGTGLGLSIALSIARDHGGQVRVASPPAKGATFTVQLPALALRSLASADPDTRNHTRARSRPALAETLAIGEPAQAQTIRRPAGKRILVVEDEPTVARFIGDVLEEQGFAVQVLFDAHEALARASHDSFDLVICDMKMPGLDGQHFYKSLKRSGSPLADNFLFVTGDTIGPQTQAFLAQNHLAFLSKPFRMEELTEHVWRALEPSRPGARTAVASRKSAARNG
jgi:signal transduction histidine kinase/ActR/RegA family two-component response regulator